MNAMPQAPTFGPVLRVPCILGPGFYQEPDEESHGHDLRILGMDYDDYDSPDPVTHHACLPLKLLEDRESAKDSLLSIKLFQPMRTMQKQHLAVRSPKLPNK